MTVDAQPLKPAPIWVLNLVNGFIRVFARTLCRLNLEQLEKIPQQGPLILAVNHVNFLDAPIAFSHLYPRPFTALAKVETWKNPVFGVLFNSWGGIPIRRGEADLSAFQASQQALADGKLLVIAPEGTRSGNGQLQKGYGGLALLAMRSGAPIMPCAFHGHHVVWKNLRRLQRTESTLEVGLPFVVNTHGKTPSREVRQQVTDEIMYQIAALLPPQFRGVYSDLSQATEEYLVFPGGVSNLKQPHP